MESNVQGSFSKRLSLHVDSVLADESHSSHASRNTARTRSLSVIFGVCAVQFVGFARFSHGAFAFLLGFSMRLRVNGEGGTEEEAMKTR